MALSENTTIGAARLAVTALAFTSLILLDEVSDFGTKERAEAVLSEAAQPKAPNDKIAAELYDRWKVVSSRGKEICRTQVGRKWGEPVSTEFRDYVLPAQDQLDEKMTKLFGDSFGIAENTRFKCDDSSGYIHAEQLGFEFGGVLNPTFCYFDELVEGDESDAPIIRWSCGTRFSGFSTFDTNLLVNATVVSTELPK